MGIKERKEREKGARREEILDAAETVFFDKGGAAATMDDVAEKAELSKGTLYLYYKSKEELYLAVALRGTEIMRKMFEEAVSTGEPTLKLIGNLGDAYYRYYKEHTDYFRMYTYFENGDVWRQLSPDMMDQCIALDRQIWAIVTSLVQKAIDEGILRKDLDPVEASVMLWSNSSGFMRLMDRQDEYMSKSLGVNLESTLRHAMSLMIDGMMTEEAKKKHGSVLHQNEIWFGKTTPQRPDDATRTKG